MDIRETRFLHIQWCIVSRYEVGDQNTQFIRRWSEPPNILKPAVAHQSNSLPPSCQRDYDLN